jgi:signal-transduction protein with cAMP-binding, CBS, and nucleotidyltransferase domain
MLTTLEKVLFLQQVPLLSSVPTEALAHLAKVATVEQKEGGTELWRRGDAKAGVWFVVNGEVAVDDGEGRFHARRGPGSDIGASSLLGTGGERETTAVTLKATVLLQVPRDEFFEVLGEHPEIARALLSSLGMRLQDMRALDC